MTNALGYSLKDYRTAIRTAWLPLVGRERLTSHEYAMTEQWFNGSVPVSLILRAIDLVAGRGATVYSLGVIKADLEALQREQARLQAGAHKPETKLVTWREKYKEDLQDLIDFCRELGALEAAEKYECLLNRLPEIESKAIADRLFQELAKQK